MALFAIADTHLPIGIDKPMDIFGSKWNNYVEKIETNWKNIVKEEDTVVIAGDISWAMYLEEAKGDFDFLENLPGKKIIMKGNHDYWWTTMAKLNQFVKENDYKTISFLQNNSYMYKDVAICGTRGWSYLGVGMASDDDLKIFNREVARLELSLQDAKKNNPEKIYAFFHFPPITPEIYENAFIDMMKKYDVSRCLYGHLHSNGHKNAVVGTYDDIKYLLVSCDWCDFVPQKLCD